MVKRCALFLGTVGYLLVIWYYAVAFAPLNWELGRHLLWYFCLSCMSIAALHSRALLIALLVLGPINAVLYAAIGFLLAKLMLRFRTTRETQSKNPVKER